MQVAVDTIRAALERRARSLGFDPILRILERTPDDGDGGSR